MVMNVVQAAARNFHPNRVTPARANFDASEPSRCAEEQSVLAGDAIVARMG